MPAPQEINAANDALINCCRIHNIWITGSQERIQVVTAILEAAEKARDNLTGLPLPSTIEQRHV